MADYGQVDASIPLGVTKGQQNPLATLGQFAETQNALNQNRLFQQQFAARQRLGQIIAAAPDLDTGLANAVKDPLVASAGGEALNQYRQAQMAYTQLQGYQQEQATSGLTGFLKALPSIAANPTDANWDAQLTAHSAVLSPSARAALLAAAPSLKTALMSGVDMRNPAGAAASFKKNAVGMLLSAGYNSDTIDALYGKATVQDLGGQKVAGVQAPSFAGGGFTSATSLPMSLAPTVVTGPYGEGGATAPVVMGGSSGGGASRPLAAPRTPVNALALPPPSGGRAGPANALSIQGPTQEQSAANEAAGKAAGDISDEMIANGKVLPSALKRIDMMTGALQGFQAGGGATMRTAFAQGLQAIKNAGGDFVTQDLIDKVGNQSLSDAQLFQSEVKPLAIGQLKEAAQGTGRVMRSEVDAFLTMMNEAKDPATLMALLNQAKYNLQVGYDQTQKYPQFKEALRANDPSVRGYGPSDFFAWYNKSFDPAKLPTTNEPGGINLAPTNPSVAKGTARVTHRYVPGKGIVPVGPEQ